MKTLSSFLVALLLTLTFSGCGMFRRSVAWQTATDPTIAGRGDFGQSENYARQLHERLNAKGVENKLVTFRYSVMSRDGGRTVTQSAVVYRNDTTPDYPWWFMDNMRGAPLWLSNTPLEEQLSTAIGSGPVEVIETNGVPTDARTSEAGERNSANDDGGGEWARRFQKVHGTRFDPDSAVDRKKMSALKNSA